MTQTLDTAILALVKALHQVPGTQLQFITPTLRQLKQDLEDADITLDNGTILPRDILDPLIEDAAIAHAECMAILKDCEGPEEPDFYPFYLYDNMPGELPYELPF